MTPLPACSYHSLRIEDIEEVMPATSRSVPAAESKRYCFQHFDAKSFDMELNRIYSLSKIVFAGNPFYEEISHEAFRKLYRPVRSLVDPKLIWFATTEEGEDVGFLFCIPDLAPAVAAMRGKRNLLAKLKFALTRRRVTAVNYKSIGIVPGHRRSSLATALMHLAYQQAAKKGLVRANLCLIRDGNPSTKLDAGRSRLLRRYALYGIDVG